jgi:hypothetical protein
MPKHEIRQEAQVALLGARVATAACVPAIRQKVQAWRDGGYKGVTPTTRILLNYWFRTDHRLPTGRTFTYHYFQREALETPPFPWSRPTLAAGKCIFNLVPCDNEFERTFAAFLQRAEDVLRFAKLPEQFGFAIEYTDGTGNLRFYEPDFVAVTADGIHHLIETKGLEDVSVAHKDRAAKLWCENASKLTATRWAYLKVPQKEFEALRAEALSDLFALAPAGVAASPPRSPQGRSTVPPS